MIKLVSGLDIGNGYVKGTVCGTNVSNIDIPSGVAYVTSTHDIKATLNDAEEIISDFYNQMDLSFDSPLINDRNRRIFGKRGLQSGMSIEEFDVYSHISKAKQPLSAMLTLGCLAGKVVQEYWVKNQKLPTDTLKATVRIALALPIGEYKKFRKVYADGYKNSAHIVEVHNFEQLIKVELTFEDVQVIAEGASAHYAIQAKGEELMNAMLADVRKMGEPLEGITAADILAATNTVGVDIGEGTVNFPVFQNGKFNPDASVTFDKGYGAVLNAALDRLQDMGHPFSSRKELQDFLNTAPTPLSRNRYKIVQTIVDEEISAFINEVAMQFSKIMNRVGSYLEVIYVYGGGATPVRNELYPALIEKAKAFGGGEALYPILYLDSRYSRYLNREGLYVMADRLSRAK
ncbi:ParM/StbA family protein [bacterium]|nr:ParM/StbA family protein [bacterium]